MSGKPQAGLMTALALAGALYLLGACGAQGPEPGHTASGALCPSTQTLTYENFGRGFFTSYCLRCHSSSKAGAMRLGAPSDHNFDALDMTRSMAAHIDAYAGAGPAATNTAMPTTDPRPSAEARKQLGEWLACGAP